MKPLDLLCGLAVALIWGMGMVYAKAAIADFPPILLMSLRFAVTALALVWFVPIPRAALGRLFIISLISAAVQYSLTFTGLKYIDASRAVLFLQTEAPFLVLLGMIFLKEKPGFRRWIGIVIAFAGVALIAGEPQVEGTDWLPLAMVLGGAFTWAIGQVMIRKMSQGDPSLSGFTLIAWVAVFAAPQLALFSFLFEENHLAVIRASGWLVWGAVVYLGLVMTALGYGLWYRLVGRYPVNRVSPFLLLLPVFGILGSVVLLGESLSWVELVGGFITITGVAIILIEKGPTGLPPATVIAPETTEMDGAKPQA